MIEIIKFETETCGQCKMLEKVLTELENELNGDILLNRIKGEENINKVKEFTVRSFPTLVFLKDGKEYDRIIGFTNKKSIMEKINKCS